MFIKALCSGGKAFALSFAVLLLGLLSSVSGQVNNSITGFVFGINRTPVTMARVELMNDLNQFIAYRVTTNNGLYNFERLSSGRFRIRVTTPDGLYENYEEDIELVNLTIGSGSNIRVTGSDRQQKDVYLKLRQEYRANPNAVGVILAQEVPDAARRDFEKAVELLEDKKTDAGIEKLQTALQVFPEYYLALRRLSDEYMKLGKFNEAIDLLLRMARVNERDARVFSQIAGAYFNLKNDDETLKYAQKSIETGNSYYPHFLIAMVNRKRGKFAESEQNFLKAKKFSENKVGAVHYQLALLYCNNLLKFNEAADELELYLKTKPTDIDKEKVKDLIKTFRAKAAQQTNSAPKS